MLLPPEDVALYFKLHRSLMHFVNQRLAVVPGISSADEFATLPLETRLELRNAFLDHVDLIGAFVDQNPANLDDDEQRWASCDPRDRDEVDAALSNGGFVPS